MFRLTPVMVPLLFSLCATPAVHAQNAASPPPGPCADNTTCADTSNCKETGAAASQCPVYSCLKNQWTRYGVCRQTRASPSSPQVTSDCPRNCRE